MNSEIVAFPSTEEEVIAFIEGIVADLDRLSDERDLWNGRFDVPLEIAQRNWNAGHERVLARYESLKQAKEWLGEMVYKRVKGIS